jgi:hypothetical protein
VGLRTLLGVVPDSGTRGRTLCQAGRNLGLRNRTCGWEVRRVGMMVWILPCPGMGCWLSVPCALLAPPRALLRAPRYLPAPPC